MTRDPSRGLLRRGYGAQGILRRTAGHGMIEVQRRDVKARIDLIRLGRRSIRRVLAAWTRRRLRILGPPLLGIDDEARVDAHGAELPDAILLHERVLVNRLGPHRPAWPAEAVRRRRPDHAEIRAASGGHTAVGHYRDDGLKLDVIVDFSLAEPCPPENVQTAADARPT